MYFLQKMKENVMSDMTSLLKLCCSTLSLVLCLSLSLSLFSTLSLLSANNLLLPLLSNFPQLSVNFSRVVTLEFGRKRESEAFKSSVCVFIRFHFSQLLLSTLCQLVLEVFSELAKLMRLTPCVFVQLALTLSVCVCVYAQSKM